MESRKVEWNKWKHFNAEHQYRDPNLSNCWIQGHKPIPLQWVGIDKNEHKRREGGPHVAPLFKKSIGQPWRSGGNHWCENGLPNLLNVLLSWVSCERLTVKSGDITNAYFQGCPLERLILMRQPPGGVPDVDISADTHVRRACSKIWHM